MPCSPRVLLVLALLLTPPLLSARETSWPQWRGPKGDNHSDDQNLNMNWDKKAPALMWKLEGMGGGYASVSVVGNRLYTTGNFDGAQGIVAVDLAGPTVAWRQKLTDSEPKHGYDGSRCTPSIDGDKLYAITSDGRISCLNTSDGEIVWTRKFSDWGGKMMSGWGYSESPLVDGDRVLCTPGSDSGMMVCLNKADGQEIWKCEAPDEGSAGKPGAGYSCITISNAHKHKHYVQFVGRGLIGVDAETGKLLWRYNRIANDVANIPTPICDGNYVFTSSGYGSGGTALLQLKKVGKNLNVDEVYYKAANELQNHHGGMILEKGHIYMGHGHNKGFPTCIEMKTGKVKWGLKQRGPGNDSAAVTMADGHIIFRYQSGEVGVVEATPAEYRLKGSFKPEVVEREGWAHPVVCQGKLFLREQNWLMCYDLAK